MFLKKLKKKEKFLLRNKSFMITIFNLKYQTNKILFFKITAYKYNHINICSNSI